MIRAGLSVSEGCVELSVTGHAQYHPGNDIVCAAASVLSQAAVQVLYELEDEGKVWISREVAEVGTVDIRAEAVKGQDPRLPERLHMAAAGFKLLSDGYPECVTFTLEEPGNGQEMR